MVYRLEEICLKVTDGSHFSPRDDSYSNIPMLSVKDMKEFDFNYEKCKHISSTDFEIMKKQDCVPKKGDVLVAKDGSYLKEIFVNREETEKAVLSSIAIFRPNQDIILPYFLCYLLKTPEVMKYVKDNCVSGSALPRIILKAFKDIRLNVPSIEVQRKVKKIIKTINDKIELNNQINDNLLKLNRILFEKYFEEDIQNTNKDLLGHICNIKYGKGLPTTKILNEGYPVYGGNGIIGYYNEFLYENPQILISCRGAASGKVMFSKPKSFVTNNSLVLECDRKLYYYLKELSLKYQYYQYTTGSAQPQITIDNIKGVEINLPNYKKLEEFNILSSNIEKQYLNKIDENEYLKKLRDTLLPKLMNGEIDLDKIES